MKIIVFKCQGCDTPRKIMYRGKCDICGKEDLGVEFVGDLNKILDSLGAAQGKKEKR